MASWDKNYGLWCRAAVRSGAWYKGIRFVGRAPHGDDPQNGKLVLSTVLSHNYLDSGSIEAP